MKIELLYFSGCPSYKEGEKNLEQALRELGFRDAFQMINIETDEMAKKYQFIGSPTIRINERDIDPRARGAQITGFKGCRIYQTEKGISGAPTAEMIKKALRQAQGEPTK